MNNHIFAWIEIDNNLYKKNAISLFWLFPILISLSHRLSNSNFSRTFSDYRRRYTRNNRGSCREQSAGLGNESNLQSFHRPSRRRPTSFPTLQSSYARSFRFRAFGGKHTDTNPSPTLFVRGFRVYRSGTTIYLKRVKNVRLCQKFFSLVWQFYEILWNIIVSTKKIIFWNDLIWKKVSKLMILKSFEYKNVQKYNSIKIESSIQFGNSSIFNKFFFWIVCHFFYYLYPVFLEIRIFNNKLAINRVRFLKSIFF